MSEDSQATYFRMSETQRKAGKTFLPTGKLYLGEKIEGLLEQYRPEHKLSRTRAVFMADCKQFSLTGIDFAEGYIHEVVALGPVSKHDEVWLGRMQLREIYLKRKLSLSSFLSHEQLAGNYWSGEASEKPVWEYLAASARVIVDGEGPVATGWKDPTKLLGLEPD